MIAHHDVIFLTCPRCGQDVSVSAPIAAAWQVRLPCCGEQIARVADATGAVDMKLRQIGTSISTSKMLPPPAVKKKPKRVRCKAHHVYQCTSGICR